MNQSVFTPALFAFGVLLSALLASLEMIWIRGAAFGLFPWLSALTFVNLVFFLLLVSIRDSQLLLFVLPFPVIPAIYVLAKVLLYHGIGRATGSPPRHPWALVFLSLVFHPAASAFVYQGFSRINPTLENLQLAIREKSQVRLEAMLWMSVTREPSMRILVNEAITADNVDAARRLLRHGADPRLEYWLRDASSPMEWLLAKWMLDRGVKPDEINTSQASPFEYIAVGFGVEELRYCIRKGLEPKRFPHIVYVAIDEHPIGDPATVGQTLKEKIQVLLDNGADVNGNGPMMFKPIFGLILADLDFAAVLDYLIEKGADVNARSVNPLYPERKPVIPAGITPLILAVIENREAYVEILLRHGADPSIKDSAGLTASDYAARPETGEGIRKRL